MKKSVLAVSSFMFLLVAASGQVQAQYAPSGGAKDAKQAAPFTGSFGPDTQASTPPAPAQPPSPAEPQTTEAPLIPVPPQQPVAPVDPATATAAATDPNAAKAPPDPCVAYMSSYDAYAFCQDRIKKIERMKEAQTKRSESSKAYYDKLQERRNPKPPVAATPAAPTTPAAAGTTPAATTPVASDPSVPGPISVKPVGKK